MAETKRKFMKVEAYKIRVYDKDDLKKENGKDIDFYEFEKHFQKKKREDKTKLEHGLATHELNNINKTGSQYEMIFSKLDSTDYPIVVNDFGEITDMKDNISNDKRIGHITCGLYDEIYKVLLLQVNFNAMNVSNIENYINEIFIVENKIVKLIPLIDDEVFRKAKKGYKTKIDISMHVSGGNINVQSEKSILFKKFVEAQEMNAVNATFSFSMGHVKKDSLEEKQAKQLLEDIEENINIIGRAKVSYKEQLEEKVTVADLLLQKLKTIIYFDIPERGTLRESAILNKMKLNYEEEFSKKLGRFFEKNAFE
ncbi:hypothetical protein KYJ98_10115 [Mammaliicoccus lentus]|uniref:DUF6731 family protein n=1 Tax=Mammaliicoccus lentus TaxID=42858 RepID=UPI001C4E1A12|nr:DUF6731 family protein [Mammaliicoccus lentus]MBW0770672.1 hypothetical protein [Mammaliicoccus lentus]